MKKRLFPVAQFLFELEDFGDDLHLAEWLITS